MAPDSDEPTNPNLIVVWQPTIDLRFELRRRPTGGHVRILQQKWICLDNGQVEWRDVPEVEE